MNKNLSKFFIVLVSIVLLSVGGYFIVQKTSIQKLPPPSIEKLTIDTADNPTYALLYIARNKGYFKEEGLEITYKKFDRGVDSLADALKGNSDLAMSYETPAVIKIYEGQNLRIIGTLHTSTKNIALVARKDKGIQTVNDLKGKKIGVTKNTAYEFFLQSYLLSQGVKLKDVTFVDGEFASLSPLLKSGKVDAVAVGNPYLYDIEKEYASDKLTILKSEVYTEESVLAGREDIIINRKEAIIRFLRALTKAENLYKTNNQQALSAVVAELPGFSEQSIRGTWDQFTPTLRLDNVLLTILDREGQWFKDNGIYKTEVPKFRNTIYTDYLKSINPDAVTLY